MFSLKLVLLQLALASRKPLSSNRYQATHNYLTKYKDKLGFD
jgi:hypothetical protein